MKSIVTGGAGFIGSHLVYSLLELEHEVTVLDNLSTGRLENIAHVSDKIRLVRCDLGTPGAWADEVKGVDWLFHLAALADIVPSIQQPDAYFRANVDGTFNILRASQTAEIDRFVYVASSSSYGIPTPESSEIRPQYPYALTKYLGEELVLHWAKVYKLPVLASLLINILTTITVPLVIYECLRRQAWALAY